MNRAEGEKLRSAVQELEKIPGGATSACMDVLMSMLTVHNHEEKLRQKPVEVQKATLCCGGMVVGPGDRCPVCGDKNG
jgi:hypothetical protein